ncbi:hypothetical protein QOZ80_4BG0332380 [Eleusine coracana subsp. coracana]|nr:hypothetical protein QOZ80_4BG0332380 [Eleusine coracana subsp. coracana]
MASSRVPIVVDLGDGDDDDDEKVVPTTVAVTPPSSRNRKRSLGAAAATSSRDSPDAFSSSPPLNKRLQHAVSAHSPIVLDDTPPPPRRVPSSAPKQPVHVVDDDMDPSLVPDDDVAETPDSVLARLRFSETPELDGSGSIDLDVVVAETPGFTSPRLSRPPAARGSSSAGPAQKSSGPSPPISLDSDDDDDDDAIYRELTGSPSYKTDLHDGTPNNGQPLYTGLPHEDSTLPDADVDTGKNRPQGAKKQQNEAEKLNRQVAKKLKEEERAKKAEERKRQQQEIKTQKEVRKAELAEKKKKEKEVSKWESGKYALECITVEIDPSVAETGSIGGLLLSSLEKNGIKINVIKNPYQIGRSILWNMKVPDDIAHELSRLNDGCDMNLNSISEVPYIAIVLQAEEFCDLVNNREFFHHVQNVRNKYPTFTICYVINKLVSYIKKREQLEYKNKTNNWKRPPVEEVLCKLATHYCNVHSRQCIDEGEVAEHLVGLTCSLAKCKFRKPLSWLSVNANGAIVPDNFVDKNLIKKNTWLKSLIAIPGIQPRYAVAIWKEYSCMRSLLNVYMDPSKTVAEKELLLSDLKWEGRLGNEGKRLGHKCSRRVYRMLMAENGNLDADPAEAGA